MSGTDRQHRDGSVFSTPWAIVLLGLLLWVAAGVATVLGTIVLEQAAERAAEQPAEPVDPTMALIGGYLAYAPAAALALLGLVVLIVGAVRCGIYGRDVRGVPSEIERREMLRLMRQMNERLALTDSARRATYREPNVHALRWTIEQDILSGNFDAAMTLVTELTETFGLREEAESYRDRIAAARHHDQQAKIERAVSELDEVIERREFDEALRDAAKLQRLYPESERVKDLPQRVAQARKEYVEGVEQQFREAAEGDDVDHALDLLKELDRHLTERDAEPLRDAARGVIDRKRRNLGVQFRMAVHEHEWVRSVEVGEQIMREFPNSRMAEEVRDMIDVLRERAGAAPASETGQAEPGAERGMDRSGPAS